MDILIFLLAGLLVLAIGASVGSFANVVIYRLPAGQSILWPPSRCPHCLHRLGSTENVPVLGWLWLRGQCRHCHAPIAWRYPLVEAATGCLFLLVFLRFEVSLQTLGYWAFFSWLSILSWIDLDTMTLPNVLTKSGLLVGLGYHVLASFAPSFTVANLANHLMMGIGGAVLGIWLFEMITLLGSLAFGKTAMGGGDSKLAAMMGAWLGWKYLLLAGFLACILGALVGVGAIASGRLDRSQPMPFGPFLALGAMISTIWGEAILVSYWQLFPTLP